MVVGASLAGVRAAETLRREGFAGTLTLVGAETHWPPVDRPPLSKQVLAAKWDVERANLRVDPVLDDAELILGRAATALDLDRREIVLDGDERLGFDGLVVATGASPRELPGTGDVPGVFVLRTVDDCLALRDALDRSPRVAVIGSGFIGAEVASTCLARGLDVTVIEALPLPLVRILGEEMGEFFAAVQRAAGIDLRLGIGVAGIEGDGRAERVLLADGTSVEADVVVVGIGVSPNVAWLEGSGVTLDNGVVCDAACAVAGVDGVVACGDVARWPNELFGELMRIEHWTNAAEQAEHAARTLLHGAGTVGPFAPVPYFWSDQLDMKVQFVGTSGPGDDVAVVEGDPAERRFVAAFGREGRTVGALCVNRAARTVPYRNLVAERAPFPPVAP